MKQETAQHTPGPWTVSHDFPGCIIAGEVAESHRGKSAMVVCKVMGNLLNSYKANAQLIAAAPLLLEALKLALEASTQGVDDYSWEDKARAAIASAQP